MISIVDEDTVKGYLNITTDKHNTLINFVIPFYTNDIENEIDVSSLTEDQLSDVAATISVGIGCHIQMADPTFGSQVKAFEIGNISKTFDTSKAPDTWCELYEIMKNSLFSKYSTRVGVVKRPGLSDEFTKPY